MSSFKIPARLVAHQRLATSLSSSSWPVAAKLIPLGGLYEQMSADRPISAVLPARTHQLSYGSAPNWPWSINALGHERRFAPSAYVSL